MTHFGLSRVPGLPPTPSPSRMPFPDIHSSPEKAIGVISPPLNR